MIELSRNLRAIHKLREAIGCCEGLDYQIGHAVSPLVCQVYRVHEMLPGPWDGFPCLRENDRLVGSHITDDTVVFIETL